MDSNVRFKITEPNVRIKITKPSRFGERVDQVNVSGIRSKDRYTFYGTIVITPFEGEIKIIKGEHSWKDYEPRYGFQLKRF